MPLVVVARVGVVPFAAVSFLPRQLYQQVLCGGFADTRAELQHSFVQ